MKNDIRIHKQAIRSFIRQHWSDQKLVEVYAFNRDGKMRYADPCGCIRGVTLADRLHVGAGVRCYLNVTGNHYSDTRNMPGVFAAEYAYDRLAYLDGVSCSDDLAARRLSAILRGEMRRRERARMAATVPEAEAQLV